MINMIFVATEKENSKCTYVVCACQPHFTLILKKKKPKTTTTKNTMQTLWSPVSDILFTRLTFLIAEFYLHWRIRYDSSIWRKKKKKKIKYN